MFYKRGQRTDSWVLQEGNQRGGRDERLDPAATSYSIHGVQMILAPTSATRCSACSTMDLWAAADQRARGFP